MRFGDFFVIAITLVLLGTSVWLTSGTKHRPIATAAAAAAMKSHGNLPIWIEAYADSAARIEDQLEYVPLCVDSAEPLDFDQLQNLFAETVILPVPIDTCRSKKVKSEDPMFAFFTHWFDQNKETALQLEVSKINCPSRSRCILDLDDWHVGIRYTVDEIDGVWTVTDANNRRISG